MGDEMQHTRIEVRPAPESIPVHTRLDRKYLDPRGTALFLRILRAAVDECSRPPGAARSRKSKWARLVAVQPCGSGRHPEDVSGSESIWDHAARVSDKPVPGSAHVSRLSACDPQSLPGPKTAKGRTRCPAFNNSCGPAVSGGTEQLLYVLASHA